MTGDGKIDSGTAWVHRVEHGVIMLKALERWFYVHGPEPSNYEVEYVRGQP